MSDRVLHVMTISTFMTFSLVTAVLRAEKYGEDGG
jgi:hypothetical protein